MANALYMPAALKDAPYVFGVFSDFIDDQSDLFFKDTITDTGTALVGDAVGGIMVLTPSDGSVADNDEVYLYTPNEIFLVAAGKPLYAEARIQFTETTSGVYNAIFGFMSAADAAANLIVDDGAGPRASGNLFVIEKRDGETVWRLTTRNGSTVTTTVSTTTAGGSAYQVVSVEVIDLNTLNVSVVASVDGVRLKDSAGLDIVHTVAIASSTEMNLVVGAKLGAATNNDVLNVDYAGGWQHR